MVTREDLLNIKIYCPHDYDDMIKIYLKLGYSVLLNMCFNRKDPSQITICYAVNSSVYFERPLILYSKISEEELQGVNIIYENSSPLLLNSDYLPIRKIQIHYLDINKFY